MGVDGPILADGAQKSTVEAAERHERECRRRLARLLRASGRDAIDARFAAQDWRQAVRWLRDLRSRERAKR